MSNFVGFHLKIFRSTRRRFGQAGFSTVEMLVVIGIFGLVIGSVIHMYTRFKGNFEPKISKSMVLQMDSRRAVDKLMEQIREGSEVIRPLLGETSSFLVFKDKINQVAMIYLEKDSENSKKLKQDVFRLKFYVGAGSGPKGPEKVLGESISKVFFTCTTPNCVQVDLALVNDQGKFEFLTQIGLLNFGDLE